jgi:hypothetical protein
MIITIVSALGRNRSQIDDIDKGFRTPGNGRAATPDGGVLGSAVGAGAVMDQMHEA